MGIAANATAASETRGLRYLRFMEPPWPMATETGRLGATIHPNGYLFFSLAGRILRPKLGRKAGSQGGRYARLGLASMDRRGWVCLGGDSSRRGRAVPQCRQAARLWGC